MAELGDFLVSGDSTTNIDVEMLDYGFIEKCEDAKILRGIIETLKSGKEGLYPELCQAAENRLFSVIPEKERRRVMRLQHKTTPDQVNDAENDLQNWQTEVFLMDEELRTTDSSLHSRKHKLPPVRGQNVEKLDIPPSPQETPNNQQQPSSKPSERLSGYDFHAWEKFNVDEALATLEEEELELEKEVHTSRLKKKKVAEEAARKRMERHSNALEVIRTEMNISSLSSVQRKTRAAREKQKGNESFRSGENEEAYSYYSRSLALDDSVAAVYSNRALVCLRTGKLETAEDDCSRALFLDPSFTKARSRRGISRLKSGKYELAIRDFDLALEHDSANKELMSLLQKAKDKYLEVEGKEYISEKERERQNAALQLAIANGLSIKVTSVSTSDLLLLPVTTVAVELLCSGACETIENPAEKLTRILIEEDSDSSCDEDDDDKLEGFTRIQIDDDSDTEDEDEENRPEASTRIQIDDDSDSDTEDDKGDVGVHEDNVSPPRSTSDVKEEGDGFVRIAITDNSDSDSDSDAKDDCVPSVEEKQNLIAENLKTQANDSMQRGDLAKAVRLYSECVAIDCTSPVAIAAFGNRSLAYLKLEEFEKVLEDTKIVLSHEPTNLKALYRRALAFEATKDFECAIRDVDEIVRMQPQNELALEARERFIKVQQCQVSLEKKVEAASDVKRDNEGKSKIRSEDAVHQIEKSIDLKTQGNEAMKAGRCEAAIEFYSCAISCDPSNVLFYNNRAQAYLKIAQLNEAEADASYVIKHSPNQSPNFKAFYRRALARKGINTMESLKLAQEDILFILQHEPANKAAITEKQKIASLLKTQLDLKEHSQNRVVEELIVTKDHNENKSTMNGFTERSSKLKVRSTNINNNNNNNNSQDQQVAPTHPVNKVDTDESTTSTLGTSKKTFTSPAPSKTKLAKDISVKNPIVPSDPPKTVYEFERIWRGLKNRPDLFAVYLQCFKKSTYKKVIKETCSPDLLSSMLVSVRDHLLLSDGIIEKGISVLEGLSSIPKYDMIRFMLPGEDLDCLRACLDYVSVHMGAEKANSLREKLKIS